MAATGVEIGGSVGCTPTAGGIDHVLVDDLPAARQALSELGMRITGKQAVLVLDVDAKTFEFARFARRLASAGVDVDLVYLATRGRLYSASPTSRMQRRARRARVTALRETVDAHAGVTRFHDRLRAVDDAELCEHVGDVIAHGLLADGELAGDRGVALTARDELEDLALAFRQVWERLGRAGRLA